VEIAPGIYQIESVRGAASYLFATEAGFAVVDTGMPGNERRIAEGARSHGFDPSKLQYILLTHSDIDHSGSVSALKGLTGASVAIHEADAPRLSGERRLKEVKGPAGAVFGLVSPLMRFRPVKPDVLLSDSDSVLGLTVVHTPGHTDGSVCFYRESMVIFVGDAMRTSKEGKPRLPPSSMTLDMEQAKQSLGKIAKLDYPILLPGHGPPMTGDASKAVARYVESGFAD
jgi:glyoxylase-like metal-dependent hydrolase (beta-lactamase superfamily II)